MATTARPRRKTAVAADTRALNLLPDAKPRSGARKKPAAAVAATPTSAPSTKTAPKKKPAAAPAKQAKPVAAPARTLAPAPARKRAAPVQQELVLDEPRPDATARKAGAKAPAAKKTAASPAPAPAAKTAARPTAAPQAGAGKKAQADKAAADKAVAVKLAAVKEAADKAAADKVATEQAAAAGKRASKPAAKPAAPPAAKKKPRPQAGGGKPVAAPPAAVQPSLPLEEPGQDVRDAGVPEAPAPAPAPTTTTTATPSSRRPGRGRGRTTTPATPATPAAPAAKPGATPRSALATAPAAPALAAAEAVAPPAPQAPPVPTGPAHSLLRCIEQDLMHCVLWQPGHACPPALAEAAAARTDAAGHLRPDDDAALPTLLRLAHDAGHRLDVDEAVWLRLAVDRDARQRLHLLEAAYADGPASPAIQTLLQTSLAAYQAEGALFAVVAGRALIADERGLGKRVQAIAAATLWRRHFGVQRVLVLCTPAQRAAWQRAWSRLAGDSLSTPPQVIEGPLHQRQALWSGAAEVRILAPEALDSDAEHLAQWAPELLIIDEPQQLSGWSALQAPHALVLCGAPLAAPPALLQSIVAWLDTHRQGALQALVRIQAAREQGLTLSNDELERLDNQLSRLMLQRLRSEVLEQLPPLVHSERLVPLAPPQRDAHDRLCGRVARLLSSWQRCGYLSDADQWQLGAALRELPEACHRSQPGDGGSALAEASIAALQAQLDDWAATGTERVALVCAQPADQALLAERLRFGPGLQWLANGDTPATGTDVVLQVGVPWRPRRPGRDVPAGQQWVYLAAQDSLELGLFDTLASRQDAPLGPSDGGGRGFLHGQRLADWLQAWTRAHEATAQAA